MAQLADLITIHPSRKAILEALGISLAKKNYVRLEERAAELGVVLPAKWAALRDKAS